MLSTTFSLLALALLASSDTAERVQRSTGESERAELAAASGVEWAVALAMPAGPVDTRQTVELVPGVSITVDSAGGRTPPLKGTGSCQGVAVTLGADVESRAGPLPYAFASFGGSAGCDNDVRFVGPVYFAEPKGPITAGSRGKIDVNDGDAFLVSTTPLTSNQLDINGNKINYGVTPIARPTVDTTPYATMVSGGVPVVRYAGTTTIFRQTLTGIVIVELALLQSLTIDDSVINGTLVVRSPLGDAIGNGTAPGSKVTAPQIRFVNSATINGGTATTGNLALLAPGCLLVSSLSGGSEVTGVSFVWGCGAMDSTLFTGQLATTTTWDTLKTFDVERPTAFVPSTPIGIVWSVSFSRTKWLGRQ